MEVEGTNKAKLPPRLGSTLIHIDESKIAAPMMKWLRPSMVCKVGGIGVQIACGKRQPDV